MKKSVKTLELKKYKSFVSVALWTVFRCWKVDQWAYQLKDNEGNIFWEQVKKGKSFYYSDSEIRVDCIVSKDTVFAELVSSVDFKDGVRGTITSPIESEMEIPEEDTVHVEVKEVERIDSTSVETKKDKIIRLLTTTKMTFQEIVEETGADISYVRKLSKKI